MMATPRAVAFEGDLLVVHALQFPGTPLDGAFDVFGRHVLRLGGQNRSAQAGLPSGSPPPALAAIVISLMRRVNVLPRLASSAPFLCLIVAHFEWPDMRNLNGSEECRCGVAPDQVSISPGGYAPVGFRGAQPGGGSGYSASPCRISIKRAGGLWGVAPSLVCRLGLSHPGVVFSVFANHVSSHDIVNHKAKKCPRRNSLLPELFRQARACARSLRWLNRCASSSGNPRTSSSCSSCLKWMATWVSNSSTSGSIPTVPPSELKKARMRLAIEKSC